MKPSGTSRRGSMQEGGTNADKAARALPLKDLDLVPSRFVQMGCTGEQQIPMGGSICMPQEQLR